jgi:hypothetical protein
MKEKEKNKTLQIKSRRVRKCYHSKLSPLLPFGKLEALEDKIIFSDNNLF